MEDFQHVGYSKEVIEFVAVAKEFCDFVETAPQMQRRDFIQRLQKFIPIRIEGSYEDEQVRQEEYKRRLQRIPGINRKIHTFRDTKGPFQNPEIKKPSNLLLKGLFCSSLLSDSNQRPRDYKSRALAS